MEDYNSLGVSPKNKNENLLESTNVGQDPHVEEVRGPARGRKENIPELQVFYVLVSKLFQVFLHLESNQQNDMLLILKKPISKPSQRGKKNQKASTNSDLETAHSGC